MGGIVLSILVWQEGGESVGAILAMGVVGLAAFVYWLVRRKRQGKPTLIDPDLFRSAIFRLGITQQMLQQIALGGMMIALPIYLQMVLEYNAMEAGLSLAPLSLSMFGTAILAEKKAAGPTPEQHHQVGIHPPDGRTGAADPDRAPGRLRAGTSPAPWCSLEWGWVSWCPSSTTTRWPRSLRNVSARPPG